MTAWLPVFPALSAVELLAGRVVPDPFDGSAVVEGTVCPTTASSPDAAVRGILPTGLKNQKHLKKGKSMKISEKVLDCLKRASYIPVASRQQRTWALTRCRSGALRVLHLSIFAWAGAALPTLIISSCFPILCTIKLKYQNYLCNL